MNISMDISSDAIKTRSIKYLLAQQIQKSILYVTFRDMIITSVLCDVILYIYVINLMMTTFVQCLTILVATAVVSIFASRPTESFPQGAYEHL